MPGRSVARIVVPACGLSNGLVVALFFGTEPAHLSPQSKSAVADFDPSSSAEVG
jgi:hypothetical protein